MPGPFSGVRVVDLTTVFVGPFASSLLGDMGADIVKVEAPGGDTTRSTGPSVNPDMSSNFLHINRNKRSITLDLKSAGGAEAMRRLIASRHALGRIGGGSSGGQDQAAHAVSILAIEGEGHVSSHG